MKNILTILKPLPRFALLLIAWGIQMALLVRVFHVTKGTMGFIMGLEATAIWFLLAAYFCFRKD